MIGDKAFMREVLEGVQRTRSAKLGRQIDVRIDEFLATLPDKMEPAKFIDVAEAHVHKCETA